MLQMIERSTGKALIVWDLGLEPIPDRPLRCESGSVLLFNTVECCCCW